MKILPGSCASVRLKYEPLIWFLALANQEGGSGLREGSCAHGLIGLWFSCALYNYKVSLLLGMFLAEKQLTLGIILHVLLFFHCAH